MQRCRGADAEVQSRCRCRGAEELLSWKRGGAEV
jgi:hypothetical protein